MHPIPDNSLSRILTHLKEEDNFVFLETSKISAQEQTSFIFHKPIKLLTFYKCDNPQIFFGQIEEYLAKGYFLAGWLAYEFGYGLETALKHFLDTVSTDTALARLGVFPPPITYSHAKQKFTSPHPFNDIDIVKEQDGMDCKINNLRPSLSPEAFMGAIARIKEYIAAGDTYQVNYTLKYFFDFDGNIEELYRELRLNQPVAYSAYLKLASQHVLSFSPELFFHKDKDLCRVKPMKGTTARGRYLHEDRQLADFLGADAKNRSENVMIVDLLRNDLGKLCETGSVKTSAMFDVETFSTLHQMTTTVTGKVKPQTPLLEIFKALFPCGSVTGAPKIRTMEIINELETDSRGIYTGAIGYIAPNGEAAFNVPIRTVVLQGRHGEMGIGAGITHSSDPQDEWQESLLKGKFLSHPQKDFQLIETILWQPKQGFRLLAQHLERLENSAAYFSYPCNREDLAKNLAKRSKQWQATYNTALRVRILLFRNGEIEINQTACAAPQATELSDNGNIKSQKLPKITISQYQTNPASNLLFHKTTRRDLYNQERDKAVENGFIEVIFLNNKNEITEGAITNIIIKKGEFFFTPPLESGLLAGVERARLLNKYPGILQEKILYRKDLENAEAIYLTNSVRGVTKVRLI